MDKIERIMLAYNEIKEKIIIDIEGEPYEVLSSHIFRKQQRKPVNSTKLRHLITGKVIERSFHQSEQVREANVDYKTLTFLYHHKDQYWFCVKGSPKERFFLSSDQISAEKSYLKENMDVEGIEFNEKIIGIRLPIKIDLRVIEAPPSFKGNTAQGGSKQVTLETGAVITVPMFVEEGDIVRVNTETGEYTERVEKK